MSHVRRCGLIRDHGDSSHARTPCVIGAALRTLGNTSCFFTDDLITRRAPHPATLWRGLFLVATQFVRTTAGAIAAWLAFARVLAR